MPNDRKRQAILFSSVNSPNVLFCVAMKIKNAFLFVLIVVAGCGPAASPGITLLTGLNNYQDEMEGLGTKPDRWPDRQRLAESLKTAHLATLGVSKEFNRLVDLDVRRREFLITLSQESVSAQRAKEIKEELVRINEQMEGLKKIVKGQIGRIESREPAQGQGIEKVATIGLLNLAIDSFATDSSPKPPAVESTQVGSYVVTDEGSFSTVRTPEGQTFRCTTTAVKDAGASIKCEPIGGKG